MADRPILFSAPMVRALLAGEKTQTRRALKPRAGVTVAALEDEGERNGDVLRCARHQVREPRIEAGDRLWVRESGHLLRECYDHAPPDDQWRDAGFQHAVDGAVVPIRPYDPPISAWIGDCARISRPSIHMPRWASRLTLLVEDVRVQRLQDISEADAIAEGVRQDAVGAGTFIGREGPGRWVTPWPTAVEAFSDIWSSINGPDSWTANPWVAAISFKVALANIDQPA